MLVDLAANNLWHRQQFPPRTRRGQYLGCAAFCGNGEQVATCSADTSIALWNATTGAQMAFFVAHSDAVARIAFSPDGNRLVSVGNDHKVRVWELAQVLKSK